MGFALLTGFTVWGVLFGFGFKVRGQGLEFKGLGLLSEHFCVEFRKAWSCEDVTLGMGFCCRLCNGREASAYLATALGSGLKVGKKASPQP